MDKWIIHVLRQADYSSSESLTVHEILVLLLFLLFSLALRRFPSCSYVLFFSVRAAFVLVIFCH